MGGPGRIVVDSAGVEYASSTQKALDALASALVVFALVAGAAGAVLVAQTVSRRIGSSAGSGSVWRGLGLTRWWRALALALPVVGGAAVGVAVGVGLAVAASPLLPVGLARRAEVHSGVWFDPAGLAVGAVVAVVAVAGWTLRSAWRSQRGPIESAVRPRPSAAGNLLARWGAGLQLVTGTRFAFESGGRLSVPVRSALVGAAIAVAGVTGAGVVVASLDSLVNQPTRWGWDWSTMPDPLGQSDPTARLVADSDLSAVGSLNEVNVSMQGHVIDGFALKPLKGSVTFTVLSGRLPVGPSEVALGKQSMADLRTSLGRTVRAVGRDGHGVVPLKVVGTVVPPPVQGATPGEVAVLTPDGLESVATEDVSPSIVLTYRAGTNPPAVERRLTGLGLSFPVFARPQLPGALRNVTQARTVVIVLGGFFGLLGLSGLVHSLTVSCRRRRSDFGVLRALGCRRRQVRGIVVIQSLAITVAGLVVGLPMGLIAGRWVWELLIAQLGVADGAATPWWLLAVVGPAALLLAALAALAPASLAERARPSAADRLT